MTERHAIATSRESLISRTFLQLTDTLIADFDIIDLLTILSDRCVVLTDADAAGILLVDAEERLRVMAASSEQARLLELFQVQNHEGPCLEACSTGLPVIHTDLRSAVEQWPRFSHFATEAGFQSVYALPLRLRGTVLGALTLFRASTEPLVDADVALAQALADVACIAILQDQAARAAQRRDAQLQHALDSRVIIEQAKGVVAERAHVDMGTAFELIRAHARNHNIQLTSVAASIVAGELTLESAVADESTS
jgi:transcriptional regulator with GAF, ATPase, and Fis domain